MSVYAPMTGYLWELLKCYGVNPEPVFNEAGVEPGDMQSAVARVPRTKAIRLQQLAEQAANDEAFGVRHVEVFHPSHYGALGFAWMSSTSLRSAFTKYCRYSRLLSHTFICEMTEHDGFSRLQFYWNTGHSRPPSQHFGTMSVIVHLARLAAGPDFCARRIGFIPEAPGDLEVFEKQFRAPMTFGQGVNSLDISHVDMDRALPLAQAEIDKVHQTLVHRYLANLDRRDTVGQVKAAIGEMLPEGEVTAPEVAKRINISVRTLRRRLRAQGLTFRELLARQRREQCEVYLSDPSLTLTEISYLLGFSSPSAFSRAYRSWTGKPPGRDRYDRAMH